MTERRGAGDRAREAARGARAIVRGLLLDVADAAVDRRCPGCGEAVGRAEAVCDACDAAVDRAGSVLCLGCLRGEAASPRDAAAGPRPGCPAHGPERLLLAGPPHAPPLDSILREFKYAGASGLAPWIASLVPTPPGIEATLKREGILVPVPLHPARRAWRGYDQAALLAEFLSTWWGIPVVPALQRVRETPPQARRGGEERRRNLERAFRLVPRAASMIAERCVLLVDDVATTGSTLHEAATALAAAGPSWILCLAASHGGGPDEAQSPSQPEVAGLESRVLESQAWQIGRGVS